MTVAEAWLPGVTCVRADGDGGRLSGGAPRVVWHTAERDPYATSARSVAHHLNSVDAQAHLVWNPLTAETVQMVPATRAACGLGGGRGGANTEGRLCIQIEVVGFARDPFTAGPLHGLDAIMGWLDSWRVPRRWPAGPPRPAEQPRNASRRQWSQGGHFGHSQVPGARHLDPGPIDIHKIIEHDIRLPRPRLAAVATSLP